MTAARQEKLRYTEHIEDYHCLSGVRVSVRDMASGGKQCCGYSRIETFWPDPEFLPPDPDLTPSWGSKIYLNLPKFKEITPITE
jgi:hypothetical protein